MKWKDTLKLFLLCFLLVLSFSFVKGVCNQDNENYVTIFSGLKAYYPFDNDANDISGNNYNKSSDGAIQNTTFCVTGNCKEFRNNNAITYSDVILPVGDKTICYWVKHSDTNFDVVMANTIGTGSGDDGFTIAKYNDGGALRQHKVGNGGDSGEYYQSLFLDTDLVGYQFYCMVADIGTNLTIFRNATIVAYDDTASGTETAPDKNFHIGCEDGGSTYCLTGFLDEISLFNRTLTQSEIEFLYDCNLEGYNPFNVPEVEGGETPSFDINTNLETINLTTDLTFYFNTSNHINITTDSFNCSLYLNNTLNESKNNILLNLTNQNFTLSYCNKEVGYNINVTCRRNEQGEEISNSFLVEDIFLDCVLPTLDIDTNFINQSSYYDDTTINYNISVSDSNLYALNHTIKDTSDNSIKRWDFVEDLNITEYQLNVSNSTSLLTTGDYVINITAWDSHTNNKVKPLHWIYEDDKFILDGEIFLYGDIKYLDNKDRIVTYFYISEDETKYKMKVTFNQDDLEHTFYLETTNKLSFISHSNYKAHFVYFPLKRWIDFEGENIKNVEVTQLGYNYFRIVVSHFYITDEFELESIGDLNINSEQWFFNITEAPSIEEEYYPSFNESLTDLINISENIEGGLEMLGIILLIVVFMLIGVFSSLKIFMAFSGGVLFWLSLFLMDKFLDVTEGTKHLFYKGGFWIMIIFGLCFIFLGILLQILQFMKGGVDWKSKSKESFNYPKY